ncbi:MAG: ROK family protein [Paludibacteraceae bacterium]|nr:ROK family protein [Paludibacteraceae bacterium]
MEKYAFGIDIGGTGTKYGLVNHDGKVVSQGTIPTQQYPDINEFCDVLCDAMKQLQTDAGLSGEQIVGVGCGAPCGNFYTGCIEHASNLPWKGIVPFAKLISERMGLKCTLTNDANAAAQGEMIYGSARGMKNFIVITLGTGVGSGIVIDGKLLYGHDGFAGELGHCKVDYTPDARPCGCGQRGCLEAYTSATGVARTAKEFVTHAGSPTLLKNLPDCKRITSKDVFDAAEKGDAVAQNIFAYTGRLLGAKLAEYVQFSSPEAIILFGGLTKAGHWIMDPVREALDANLIPLWKGKIPVSVSTLKDSDAAILGASSLVFSSSAPSFTKTNAGSDIT